MLAYKLAYGGKHFIKVDKWFPSSRICNQCGRIHKLKLSERVDTCPCGCTTDRDLNVARNIIKEGLQILKTA
ncbi:MAG TPA: transposase [Candidatus Blautia faecipullorum]|nr:transposase [Candidatus Blautia faecipullorum]